MNSIKIGTEYTAESHKTGTGEKGDWECITLKDENGKNPVTIFVTNRPSRVEEGSRFRIDRITGISSGVRKVDDRWLQSTKIFATVAPV